MAVSSDANPKSGFPKASSVNLSMSNNVPKAAGMVVKSAEFRDHPKAGAVKGHGGYTTKW